MPDSEIRNMIEDKLRMYPESIRTSLIRINGAVTCYDNFVYICYAESRDLKVGCFELYRYYARYRGVQLYDFYVQNPPIERSVKFHKEAYEERKEKIKQQYIAGKTSLWFTRLKKKMSQELADEIKKYGERPERLKAHRMEQLAILKAKEAWAKEKINVNIYPVIHENQT